MERRKDRRVQAMAAQERLAGRLSPRHTCCARCRAQSILTEGRPVPGRVLATSLTLRTY